MRTDDVLILLVFYVEQATAGLTLILEEGKISRAKSIEVRGT